MSGFFSTNSPLWRALTKLADLVWLNILFVICCIPVFTMGAALSAMYSVTLKLCINEEGSISQDFFKSFRENFKQGTALWLIMLGIAVIVIVDFMLIPFLGGTLYEIAFVVLTVIGILYIMVFSYLFPLQSRFSNPVKRTMMNALYLATRHMLPTTVAVSILTALPVYLLVFQLELVVRFLPLVILILFSGIAFINSLLFTPIFRKYIVLQEQALAQNEEEV